MPTPRAVVFERALYIAAAPFLGAAANLPQDHPMHTAVVLAGGAGVVGCVAVAAKSTEGTGRKLMRLSPLALAAAVEVAASAVPGWGWDALFAGVWAAAGCIVLPLSRTSRRLKPALAATPVPPPLPAAAPAPAASTAAPAPVPADGADALTRGVRGLWERADNPGRTHVVTATRHPGKRHDLTMLLRASDPGRPITGLSEAAVAAAFGITEPDVVLLPVTQQAGRQGGPGWLEVKLVPEENRRRREKPTDAERWADGIGATAIPGSRLTGKRRNPERGVTYWTAHLPDGEPRIDLKALCKALGTSADDGRVFVTVDGADVLVSVWDVSPLATVYPATRELLTPDAQGRWVCGFLTNGQPARNRVYTDRGAAHGLYVAPSGGGKTQLMALAICAAANFGAVVWLVTEAPDSKTPVLGEHCDRYGVGALYMVRAMRAAVALMEIRGTMLWADGQVHEWDPALPGCPYRPLAVFWDEFLSAARNGEYGAEIMNLAETISVKGRKYGIGEHVAGQSVYVQDGFTQLLNENLRENCIPVVLKVAPKKVAEMFKTLGVTPEDIPDPLPRSFSPAESGRIERIMNGEPEPPSDSNTGGVGWIIESRKPEVLRTLFIDFQQPIAPLFPDTVHGLTDHEIAELEARDLWFDWNEPPRPGEFGPEPDDQDEDGSGLPSGSGPRPGKSRSAAATASAIPTQNTVTTTRQALDAIKKLTGA
ncbi:chromosome segregation protein ParM [Kitasatospora sp. NPDC085895]|uniref:chromosome segregation protein ParM n=1 Tax=Kitasatospora sp. NPDC085895 TaxID=3155057 RepID=UPI00344DC403